MQTEGRTETSQIPNGSTESLDSLSKRVGQLQEELKKSKAEKQQALEKLDSLLFLIRRSWNGDNSATLHLSRMVGLHLEKETNGLAAKSKRAMNNWFLLTIGLLDQERKQDLQRMHQKQISHIEQRYKYMQHVLNEHHKQMAQFIGHIDGNDSLGYHDNWDYLPRSNRAKRRHSLSTQRIKSAIVTSSRKASCPTEVDISKLCFKDLLIQPAPAVPRVTITSKNNIYPRRPVSAFSQTKQSVKNVCRPKTAALTSLSRKKKKQNVTSALSAKEIRHSISRASYSPETKQNELYKRTDFWMMKKTQTEKKANNASYLQKTLTKNQVTFASKTVQLQEGNKMKTPHSANNSQKSNLHLQIRLGIPEESRV